MSYTNTPTDTAIAASGAITFSSLKNTLGPSGGAPIKFSDIRVGTLGDIGQTDAVSSFRGKNIADPGISVSTPVDSGTASYESQDTTFTLNTNYKFNKRVPRSFNIGNTTLSFSSSRFGANMNTLTSGTTQLSISNSSTVSSSTTFANNSSIPINVTYTKRNGIQKTALITNVDASDIVTAQYIKYNLTVSSSQATFKSTHHGHHHILHHDQTHHSGGGTQHNQGNPGHRHNHYAQHHHRQQYRYPDSATGRNPHTQDQRGTHHNRDHGHHHNRDHGHHHDYTGAHHNKAGQHHNNPQQSYGKHHHNNQNHNAYHHNSPAYHHQQPAHHNNDNAHHHNHAHHSGQHHTDHSHTYKTTSGAQVLVTNGSDLTESSFTLTVNPKTGTGLCNNQQNLVVGSDNFDQISDSVVACIARYSLSIKPSWTTTSYESGTVDLQI